MSWHSKYLTIFDKPIDEVPDDLIREIRNKVMDKQSDEPLASVILIAHNEERRILSCIWSLSENICNIPIEIIAVNNNSTDNTMRAMELSGVISLDEKAKGPGHARQCGLNHARGKYHICIDSDTLYPPYYIQTMVDALSKPNIVYAFSLWSFMNDNNHSSFGLFFYELFRDFYLYLQSFKRPELCVRGMAFAFNTELGKKIGFRTDIKRGEDGSLALALKAYGKSKFIQSRKVRVLTSNSTLNLDGSFRKSFTRRLKKAFKNLTAMLHPKNDYVDKDSNLIK